GMMKRSVNVTIVILALACGLLTTAVCAQDDASGKYVPDIGTFLQIGACSPSGYSWDGNDVYFTSSMSGASQVYRLTDAAWPYQLTTFEDGLDFFVLNYGGDMAVLGASIGGSEQSQLYLMDTQTGRVSQLTDYEDVQFGSVAWAKDDQSIFYRSNEANGRDFFLYRKPVSGSAEATRIFGDSVNYRGYNVIADLSQDGQRMLVGTWTSNYNNSLYLLDLITGEFENVSDDDKDVVYGNTTLMPDNKTIYLTCNDNEDGTSRLATMKVGSPKVEFVNDGWLDRKWEVESLGFSRDYKYMVATTNEDGYVRMKIREVESKAELASPPLDGMLGGGMFDQNGSMIISFMGPTRAPDVWRWNPETEELTQLTFSIYAGIDRTIFRDPQLIHYKTFDGLDIPAFLYLPPDYVEGTEIPFVVHAHGGPEGQYQPYFVRNIQYMMLNGYGVIAPNPRGSSGYGLSYMNLDNYKNRLNSLKDYKACVEWLIEKGYTKQGMIGIRGGSYGGYVVMGMITEYPDLFNAAINIVGIVNFKSFLENTKAYRRALREAEYGPLSDPEFLTSISPIHKADKIVTPLLVIHGVNDPRVPIGEARQIIAALEANGQAVDSLIFPDEGHGASKRVNIIAEYRKQVKFFNRHLKGIQ
ncbi:MAG: prolyl oligopeptidase family serine peptidase, partial [candidate division Zixibacteria bacterium]